MAEDENFEESNHEFCVCPFCGIYQDDIFKSGDYECLDCGRNYHVEVQTEITYTTTFPKD